MPIYIVTEHGMNGTVVVGQHVYGISAATFAEAVARMQRQLQTAPHLQGHAVTMQTYAETMYFQIAAHGTDIPVSGVLTDRPLKILTEDGSMGEAIPDGPITTQGTHHRHGQGG